MAGSNAAWIAAGMEGEVIIIDRDVDKLRVVDQIHKGRILTVTSNRAAIEYHIERADLVIGAVLIPGARAPVLVTEEMVASMRPGTVVVDISVDQGGCVETIRMTTHSDPTYLVHGVIHYGVANMPGAVPRTSTIALTNATLPFVRMIANMGFQRAIAESPSLAEGVNVYQGRIVYRAVADSQGRAYTPLGDLV